MSDTPVIDPPTSKPQQDPTALTTEKVQREIEQAIELLRVELRGEIKNLVTRFDGMDKALELLQDKADRSPTIAEMQERFEGFRALTVEVDKRYQAEFVKLQTTTQMMVQQQELALSATKEATSLAMDAAEKAVQKAENAAEKRFESLNEFRQQLADQQMTFARTDLVSQRADSLEKKMDEISRGFESRVADNRDRINTIESSFMGMSKTLSFIAATIGAVVAIVGLVIARG